MKSKSLLLILFVLLAGYFVWKQIHAANKPALPFNRTEQHLVYTRHARCRMACRHIDDSEVREILEKGIINYSKSEPAGRPDPKFALEGITHDNQRVRIIFAPSEGKMVVITVIDLNGEWHCDC